MNHICQVTCVQPKLKSTTWKPRKNFLRSDLWDPSRLRRTCSKRVAGSRSTITKSRTESSTCNSLRTRISAPTPRSWTTTPKTKCLTRMSTNPSPTLAASLRTDPNAENPATKMSMRNLVLKKVLKRSQPNSSTTVKWTGIKRRAWKARPQMHLNTTTNKTTWWIPKKSTRRVRANNKPTKLIKLLKVGWGDPWINLWCAPMLLLEAQQLQSTKKDCSRSRVAANSEALLC